MSAHTPQTAEKLIADIRAATGADEVKLLQHPQKELDDTKTSLVITFESPEMMANLCAKLISL